MQILEFPIHVKQGKSHYIHSPFEAVTITYSKILFSNLMKIKLLSLQISQSVGVKHLLQFKGQRLGVQMLFSNVYKEIQETQFREDDIQFAHGDVHC